MRLRNVLVALMALGLLTLGTAQAQMAGNGVPAQFVPNGSSSMLVDSGGRTLYTFDRDASGKSNCYVICAQNWPPLVANAASKPVGDFTIVTRNDGSKQWAYKGKPLYYWHLDATAGDKKGNNIGGVWHLVTP